MKGARLELFKRGSQLERSLPFLSEVSKSMGGIRVNLPNKSKGQTQELLESAEKILQKQPSADICLHYSLKNMPPGVARLRDFLKSAFGIGVRRVLLVSGTGKRPKEDAIACLEQLATTDLENLPRLGVAFSPFDEEDVERLRRKLSSGVVQEIWLQIGSDTAALRPKLELLQREAAGIQIYGSIFLPTQQLLRRMREKPWNGVDLTCNGYLDSLDAAQQVTTDVLALYKEFGVLPLIESPVETLQSLRQLDNLFGFPWGFPDAKSSDAKTAKSAKVVPKVQAVGDKNKGLALMWFRLDLRLHDNPALLAASAHEELLPVFIEQGDIGGAGQVWLKEGLQSLAENLQSYGSELFLQKGDALKILEGLCKSLDVKALYFNRRYEPSREAVDHTVEVMAESLNITVTSFPSYLLYEPSSISMTSGFHHGHWGTLLPFLRACQRLGEPQKPVAKPQQLPKLPDLAKIPSCSLDDLQLADVKPNIRRDWREPIRKAWGRFSEEEALNRLKTFVQNRLGGYEKDRSRADLEENPNSQLSPYLRWGQLSPQDIYWAVKDSSFNDTEVKTFIRRLFWRDLAYFHFRAFPRMDREAIRKPYASVEWRDDEKMLRKWQQGKTGFPLIDASMRELWQTGWCQQNIRMAAASFLIEYCNIDWIEGAKWYEDTLVDADIAINSMMWQNAGRSGIDQWNFTISPTGASQDPSGTYVRRWIPELRKLPNRFLHKPWDAPRHILEAAEVVLGTTYPHRCITDAERARQDSKNSVVKMRKSIQNTQWNDPEGYDVIQLPDGQLTKVFTRREFRLANESTGNSGRVSKRSFSRSSSRSDRSRRSKSRRKFRTLKAMVGSIELD